MTRTKQGSLLSDRPPGLCRPRAAELEAQAETSLKACRQAITRRKTLAGISD